MTTLDKIRMAITNTVNDTAVPTEKLKTISTILSEYSVAGFFSQEVSNHISALINSQQTNIQEDIIELLVTFSYFLKTGGLGDMEIANVIYDTMSFIYTKSDAIIPPIVLDKYRSSYEDGRYPPVSSLLFLIRINILHFIRQVQIRDSILEPVKK